MPLRGRWRRAEARSTFDLAASKVNRDAHLNSRAMSKHLDDLFANNRRWAAAVHQRDPGFFTRLAKQQNPRCMWIGCADSRVPANEITGRVGPYRPARLCRSSNVAATGISVCPQVTARVAATLVPMTRP
jgi:hypothetical protein